MTGSLQTKNGKFYIVLNFKDNKGKYKTKWIGTGLEIKNNKRKAEQMIPNIVNENLSLENQEEEKQEEKQEEYFVDFLKSWLENKKDKIELLTWESYDTYVSKHLVPYFEILSLKLTEIKPKHIIDYYECKFKGGRCDGKEGGLSVRSIKSHSLIIKEVLNDAVIREIINRNPAEHVPLPKQEKEQEEKCVFLNAEQANILLEAFRGNQLQPLVYITLYYGLRRSEVLGLKWNAIDFENDTLKIQHTIVKNITTVAKDRTKTQTAEEHLSYYQRLKLYYLK